MVMCPLDRPAKIAGVMAIWNANAEVEQSYELRERAALAREHDQHDIAELLDQAARLAMVKAQIFQGLDKIKDHLADSERRRPR